MQMDEAMKERVLQGAKLLLLEKSNVRQVAKRIGCSKSTVHKDLSERLIDLDYNLYIEVQKLFEINKQEKHLRGGNTTKLRYTKNTKIK